MPQAYLVVAGRPYGTDAGAIRALVEELDIGQRVRLDLRFIPDEKLGLYFRAADLVALPYLAAAQSAACFTAYAFRRPVVATAVGGLKEQVKEGETGLLVEPRSVPGLSAAVIELLKNPEWAEAMGNRARNWGAGEQNLGRDRRPDGCIYRAAGVRLSIVPDP